MSNQVPSHKKRGKTFCAGPPEAYHHTIHNTTTNKFQFRNPHLETGSQDNSSTSLMAGGRTRASPSKGGSPIAVEAAPALDGAPSPAGDTNVEGVRRGGTSPIQTTTSPIQTTQIDGFSIEEMPNLGIEGSSMDWVIDGVEDLDADAHCHMTAFYKDLWQWYCQRDYTAVFLTKAGYDERVKFSRLLINDGDCRSGFMAGYSNAYKWAKKYHVITVGEESQVLVLHPKENQRKKKKGRGVLDVTAMRLEDLQQPTYAEKLFTDL